MRRGHDWQKGHLGATKFADITDWESSFSQCRSLVVGEGPVKGDRVGVLGA